MSAISEERPTPPTASWYVGPPPFNGKEQPPCQCAWIKQHGCWHMARHGPDCPWHNADDCCPGEPAGAYGGPTGMHSDDCRTLQQPYPPARLIKSPDTTPPHDLATLALAEAGTKRLLTAVDASGQHAGAVFAAADTLRVVGCPKTADWLTATWEALGAEDDPAAERAKYQRMRKAVEDAVSVLSGRGWTPLATELAQAWRDYGGDDA